MKKAIIVVLSLLLVTTSLFADGNRKGFVIGLGAGGGMTSFTQEVFGFESDRENKFGLATDFKIGFGLSDNLIICYTNKVNWFGMDNMFDDTVTIINGLSAAGIMYYFNGFAPSLFITGGVGIASWATPFEEDTDTWTGFGFFAGFGFEFSPHWSVEASVFTGNPSAEEEGIEITTKAFTGMVTLNWLWY
ncbi:hypothetical protein JXO52_04870 [bacterium]|nr:hypothetical protein [bacterium]